MTTADGVVVRLISRDSCPCLDDYEPDYSNPAAAAITPANSSSVTWDPMGPTYDEPRAPVAETKGAIPSQEGSIDDRDRWIIPKGKTTGYRMSNASAIPSQEGSIDDKDRWIILKGKSTGYRVSNASAIPSQEGSASSWKSADNDYSGYTIQASDLSDSSDDEHCESWTHPMLSANAIQFPRKRGLRPHQVGKPIAGLGDWTLVKKISPKPIKLTPRGIHGVFYYLLEVAMAPSARKAVTGDGICIGLTFKSSIHSKTSRAAT